jgi:uncharacterized protein YdhG (YjbR/CyaY superfamily)
MPEHDRVLAERIHAIVTTAAPELAPKTWYGMPAYARDGKVVCSRTWSARPCPSPVRPQTATMEIGFDHEAQRAAACH